MDRLFETLSGISLALSIISFIDGFIGEGLIILAIFFICLEFMRLEDKIKERD